MLCVCTMHDQGHEKLTHGSESPVNLWGPAQEAETQSDTGPTAESTDTHSLRIRAKAWEPSCRGWGACLLPKLGPDHRKSNGSSKLS